MKNKETGILEHIDLNYAKLSYQEKNIIKALSNVFLITFVKQTIFKSERYCYAFLKPTEDLKEKYRLQTEILVVINSHTDFDSRSFDYVDKLLFEFHNRLDKLCVVFISEDKKVKEKINKHTQQNPESRIIIPFSYYDLVAKEPTNLINQRLKEFFYGRDLFSFESPLQNDTYFYGRTDTVQFFYDKYQSGENCGLFGLRKIGKTSVLFALRRYLILRNEIPVFIDCQEPSFHKRRWFECLQFIVLSLIDSINSTEKQIDIDIHTEYNEKDAGIYFQEDMLKIYYAVGEKRMLLILDEIESICFDISPSNHWNEGEDFILFWQTIRAIYQKKPFLFSFIIAGVNPKAIETPTIKAFDNPIYRMISPTYLKFFTGKDVKEMVGMIGNYMGLNFEEEIFTYLTEDFGGHPFLIRQVCSKIHQDSTKNRPITISKYYYQERRETFEKYLSDYIELIIEVLRRWYPIEYKLIELLAIDDYSNFEKECNGSEKILEHLVGYNVIEKSENKYYVRISAVKRYFLEHTKVLKAVNSIEEKWKIVTEKRNTLELLLRKTVKLSIKINYGTVKGKDELLKIIESNGTRKERMNALSFEQMFGDKAEIYLEDLRKYINKNWVDFEKIYADKQLFDLYMNIINTNRIDAHAKDIDEDNLRILIVAIDWLYNKSQAFLE